VALKPGEAVVLFIRRSEKESDKYFVAVRRSEISSFDTLNDFIIGQFQIPVVEFKNSTNLESALNAAIAKLTEI